MSRKEEEFQQIRDERREQILQEASRLFLQKGVANLKIGDLSREAGMSQGLLYRYFTNKEEIMANLMERAKSRVIPLIQEAIDRPGAPCERLTRLTERWLQLILDDPNRFRLIQMGLSLPGPSAEKAQEIGQFLRESLRGLVVEGQEAGQFLPGDPDRFVVLYLCTLQGLSAGLSFFGTYTIQNFPDARALLRILEK